MRVLHIIGFVSWLALSGCGAGLREDLSTEAAVGGDLSGDRNRGPRYPVAANPRMVLDANDVSGNGTIPNSACMTTTWVDLSGNGKNGTLTCGIGGFAGAGTTTNPYSIAFDGTTTRVGTTLSALPSAMASTTWLLWVRPTSTALSHVLSIDNHSGAFNRALTTNVTAGGSWELFEGAGAWSATTLNLNQWQFVAATFTSGDLIFYRNNTVVARGVAPTYNNTGANLAIGRSAGGAFDYFSGNINYVAVYDRALTGTEISDTCHALRGRFLGASCP